MAIMQGSPKTPLRHRLCPNQSSDRVHGFFVITCMEGARHKHVSVVNDHEHECRSRHADKASSQKYLHERVRPGIEREIPLFPDCRVMVREPRRQLGLTWCRNSPQTWGLCSCICSIIFVVTLSQIERGLALYCSPTGSTRLSGRLHVDIAGTLHAPEMRGGTLSQRLPQLDERCSKHLYACACCLGGTFQTWRAYASSGTHASSFDSPT